MILTWRPWNRPQLLQKRCLSPTNPIQKSSKTVCVSPSMIGEMYGGLQSQISRREKMRSCESSQSTEDFKIGLFFFLFLFFFMFYVYMQGCDRLKRLYIQKSSPACCPLAVRFCAVSPRLTHDIWGFSPPGSDFIWLNPQASISSPARSFLCCHSSSRFFAPSLPPTSVDFKKSNKGPIAFSLASSSASPFLSVQLCQPIPSLHRALRSFCLAFLHRRHLA